MNKIKSISVFCGSSPGASPVYKEAAVKLGKILAEADITLIYGGSTLGMMGFVSEACLKYGGKVIGVMPKVFDGRVEHPNLTELIITENMHERKAKMFELSDAFIALPGGIGTIEEIMEIATWAQIGIHQKPFGFLNIAGYYKSLRDFMDNIVKERFMLAEHRAFSLFETEPEVLLEKLKSTKITRIDKWVDRR